MSIRSPEVGHPLGPRAKALTVQVRRRADPPQLSQGAVVSSARCLLEGKIVGHALSHVKLHVRV
ncbi:MAG: hypothetical protein ACJ8AG_29295, partial [Ktedonobacteraceae bacterium]